MPIKSRRSTTRNEFHESYYEHSCAVIEMKDVLKTDIKGGKLSVRLKRWWHGLFLLSYKDQRHRQFYTSSHALRMERSRHFRNFRGRIHPLSKFRNFWDCLMFIIFIMNKFIFHHNTSIIFGQLFRSFYYIGALIELIIIIDIYVNLKTGYIDHEARKIILDKHAIWVHYASTKLFLHVASAIPLQWIMFIRYGSNVDCSLCKTNKFIATLKVLSIFGLLRLYETSSILTRDRNSFKLFHFLKFLRIFILGVITMLQFIDLTDMFALMSMISTGQMDEQSYVTALIRIKYVRIDPPSNYVFFVFNLARICKCALLFTFSFRRTKFYFDKMISLMAFVISNMFYMWTILECFSFISRIKFYEDTVITMQDTANNLVDCRQLPDQISSKLKHYFDYNQAKVKVMEEKNGLWRSLPIMLKKEIFISTNMRYVIRIPYFLEWPIAIIEEIVMMMRKEIYLRMDMVAEPWVQSEGLMVVAMGELAVYSKEGHETGHLIDGDYFGELSLVTDKELRTSSVVALSPAVILILDKTVFRRYMRQYADLFFLMKQQLKEKFSDKSHE